MSKIKGEISLLPKEKDENRLEQASDWIITTGRWVVVFTLFFVLLAFLSRFWLDQRIADLYAQSAQRIAIVEASKDFEEDFRLLQNQFDRIQALDQEKPNQAEQVKKIIAILPERINLTSINIVDDQVDFTIISQNELDLNHFFQNLILCPYLDQINIANISTKTFGIETEISVNARFVDVISETNKQ